MSAGGVMLYLTGRLWWCVGGVMPQAVKVDVDHCPGGWGGLLCIRTAGRAERPCVCPGT